MVSERLGWSLVGGGVGGILYVLAGYPLGLWLASRRRRAGPDLGTSAAPPTITILLPVHNGERWIAEKLTTLCSLDYPKELVEILVLCDGCTDATVRLARSETDPRVSVFDLARGGKGAALNAGLERAGGDILVFFDVRQQVDTDCLSQLTRRFADAAVGAVTGELIIRGGGGHGEESVRLYWRYEKLIRRCQSQLGALGGVTGAIYAMRRGLAKPLPPDVILDDVFLPLQAVLRGYRVEFEEHARAYDDPTSLKAEFGRKVRTQAGIFQLIGYCPWLLGWRNRLWFHFWSHKIGRVLLPYFLIAVGIGSLLLPGPWRITALASQALLYGAAAVDRWVPESVPIKRLTSTARTFVILVLAAFVAGSILFRPSRSFWKHATGTATS